MGLRLPGPDEAGSGGSGPTMPIIRLETTGKRRPTTLRNSPWGTGTWADSLTTLPRREWQGGRPGRRGHGAGDKADLVCAYRRHRCRIRGLPRHPPERQYERSPGDRLVLRPAPVTAPQELEPTPMPTPTPTAPPPQVEPTPMPTPTPKAPPPQVEPHRRSSSNHNWSPPSRSYRSSARRYPVCAARWRPSRPRPGNGPRWAWPWPSPCCSLEQCSATRSSAEGSMPRPWPDAGRPFPAAQATTTSPSWGQKTRAPSTKGGP